VTQTGPTPTPAASSSPPPRKVFALTGRSRPLDPTTDAVRPDIADIRLADRVFAPHYAQALRKTVAADALLCAARGEEAELLATLRAGEAFDLLDVTGGSAWGIAVASGLVGYVDVGKLSA
jgi:hypothetical protein